MEVYDKIDEGVINSARSGGVVCGRAGKASERE